VSSAVNAKYYKFGTCLAAGMEIALPSAILQLPQSNIIKKSLTVKIPTPMVLYVPASA
jgi:hypothetical protein